MKARNGTNSLNDRYGHKRKKPVHNSLVFGQLASTTLQSAKQYNNRIEVFSSMFLFVCFFALFFVFFYFACFLFVCLFCVLALFCVLLNVYISCHGDLGILCKLIRG